MIDDMLSYHFDFPDDRPVLGAECEAEAAKVRASLPTPTARVGPQSSFERAQQMDDFRRQQEAQRLHEISCEIDPRYRKPDDAARAVVAERQATEPRERLLEKSGDRRRASIASWMREQFALGKSASELVEHARKHDPSTALLLEEIAAGLEAT